MSFTITSAQFVNEQNTAVLLTTVEEGTVLISLKDRPELWDQYIQSGVPTSPFVPLNVDNEMDNEIERIFNNSGFTPALARVMFSELNILRQALSLQQRTPAQALNAIKARKRT